MQYRHLRECVCEVNREIGRTGLALFTWGNASGVERTSGVMAIKPSGVHYDDLRPEDIVVLRLDTGAVAEGELHPSSDTPTHLHLYRSFDSIGGVVHTHAHYATAWAQARKEIPCYGTTHADYWYGPVPLTRMMTEDEVRENYELNTGAVIAERFADGHLDPDAVPGVLVAGHGPFAWGPDAGSAFENAVVLEEVARMAAHSLALDTALEPVPRYLLDKHYCRKHGDHAYYGQR